jgi:hypothetical protein
LKIPPVIIQGDSVTWRDVAGVDSLGNPVGSPDWTLAWYFSGPTILTVNSTAYQGGWETSLTSIQTSALTAGTTGSQTPNYYWQATATKGANKVTLGNGQIAITKNLATAVAGFDGRTQAEIDLASVQSAIRARISGGVISEYYIGTRRLRYEGVAELLALESSLKLVVSKERRAQSIANNLGDPRNVFVRFS